MQAWMVEIKHNLKKRLKVPIFLEVLFAMEAMKVTQSNLEEKRNPCILKYEFSLAKRPIYFHISSTITFKPTIKQVAISLKSMTKCLLQSSVSILYKLLLLGIHFLRSRKLASTIVALVQR